MTAVPIKRRTLNTETEAHRGKWCEDTDGEDGPLYDWGDASTSQGTPPPQACWQTAEARRDKEGFFPRFVRERESIASHIALQQYKFGLLGS